jgi:protein SCO1
MRLATLLLALTSAACAGDDPAVDARRFQLAGVVVGREASPPRIVVAHDAINGLMPAMTMAFEVTSAAPALRDGDRIIATLVVTGSRSWLEDVRITASGGAAPAGVSGGTRATPGALVPAVPLLDQDGRSLTLRDFAGRVVVLTFLYTRCPLPDFCPLMIAHLEHVRRRANELGIGERVALLGVTLDPAYDTPAVLRAYGDARLAGPDRFDQWTLATGNAAQIDDLARYFGVGHRGENGVITHTLATAVVGHDSRIVRTFAANAWRPDDVLEVVRAGVERAAAAPRR